MKRIIKLLALSSLLACNSEPAPIEVAQGSSQGKNGLQLSAQQMANGDFQLARPQTRVFSQEIACTGNTEVAPQYQAEVSPFYGGYVAHTSLMSGQQVEAGEVLFYLEDPFYIEIQEQYLQATAQLQWQENDYQRQKALAAQKATAEKDLLARESAYQEAQARWHALRKKLALLNIDPDQLSAEKLSEKVAVKAPISGFISEVNLSKGKYLAAGELALKIIDNRHLHLGIQIFEQDLNKVALGQTLLFRPQSGQEWHRAQVRLINPALKADRGTAMLHADILNKDLRLSPGMYVEARLLSKSDSLLALPIEALVEEADRFFVYRTVNESKDLYRMEKVEIDLSMRNSDYFSAPQLKASNNYLSRGAFRLSAMD